ncbi:MAG: type VI secretion system-associated FHA domain protein TagH [Gallionellaceae bacterium]|nr:type VI secretion system-associated FHA domain protein TagH [Gallionellaceae bacterium]
MFDGLSPSHGSAGDAFKQDPFFLESAPDDGPSTVFAGFQPDVGGSLGDMVQSPPSAADDPLLGILQSGDAKAAGKGAAGKSLARPADSGNASIDQFLGVGGTLDSRVFGPATTPPSDATLPGASGLGGHGDHVHDINLPFNAPARKGAATASAAPARPVALAPGQFDESVFADLLGSVPNSPQPSSVPNPPSVAPPDDLFSVLDGLIEKPPAAGSPAQAVAARPQVAIAPSGTAPPVESPSTFGGQAGLDLIAKLAEGLNMPGLKVPPSEAEAFMVELGQMFRTAVEGVHTLLLLRAEVKKELRAEDRTMIASRENNPLKHTETVEEALNYLLAYGAPNPAFLSPARAMEDAFKDMRAHELAVMAGMRAGLAGVLKRFDPKALEPRIKKAGAFDSVVPALYKAKLWDTYTEFYKDIESEAEDHFDKLFGREFVRAYMEQTKQLKKSKKS